MGELLFSYAKPVQERMFLFIANDHHSQGLFTNRSDSTLTYFSRSWQLFLIWLFQKKVHIPPASWQNKVGSI